MNPREDRARASIAVAVPPAEAFRIFTEEIDRWWRAGLRYRVGGGRAVVLLEPGVGGRLLQRVGEGEGATIVVTGEVLQWQPPELLVLRWRATNFAPDEWTRVEVRFTPQGQGTFVTVEHSGWAAIRPDHPARHGEAPARFLARLGMWWADLLRSLQGSAR